jgi:hypothetical protein
MAKDTLYRVIGDVAPDWKRQVKAATAPVSVFSPFITQMAERVFLTAKALRTTAECHVYTRFEQKLFVTQRGSTGPASSIVSLKRLFDANVKIYDVPKLHAKVFVIPNQFASVGSQNLTTWGGTQSLESTLVTTDPAEIQKIVTFVEVLKTGATEITRDRIEKMVNIVHALAAAEKFRKREFAALDEKLAARDAELLAKEEARQKKLEDDKAAAELHAAEQARIKQVQDDKAELERKEQDKLRLFQRLRKHTATTWQTVPKAPYSIPAKVEPLRVAKKDGSIGISLKAPQGSNLRNWIRNDGNRIEFDRITTIPFYVCLIEDTWKIAFVKLAKTFITKIFNGVDWHRKISIAGEECEVHCRANWDAGEAQSNLDWDIEPDSLPKMTLHTWFGLDGINLLDLHPDADLGHDLDEDCRKWLANNSEEIKRVFHSILLSRFEFKERYCRKLWTVS